MNHKQWKELSKTNHQEAYYWYNKVTKKIISKEFESAPRTDKDAKVIHHLRDTEEQRKYNDEHYEMFGFEIDERGNEIFEYGKYVVFWTKEHHNEYHRSSKETNKKRSESLKRNPPMKGKHHTEESLRKIRAARAKQIFSDETCNKIRKKTLERWQDKEYHDVHSGENSPMYGKHHTEESRKKMSNAANSLWENNEERKEHFRRINLGENNPMYGKHLSEDTKDKIRQSNKLLMTDERRKKCASIIAIVKEKFLLKASRKPTV